MLTVGLNLGGYNDAAAEFGCYGDNTTESMASTSLVLSSDRDPTNREL
jgi:hypothetical protein